MDKGRFNAWLDGPKWDQLSHEQRESAWIKHIQAERRGSREPHIIGENDHVLRKNMPDPLHGRPNVMIYNQVYGSQAWQNATPFQRYKRWAERVLLERKDPKVDKIVTEAEERQAKIREKHEQRLAEAAAAQTQYRDVLAGKAAQREAQFPPLNAAMYDKAFGDGECIRDAARAGVAKGRWEQRIRQERAGNCARVITAKHWEPEDLLADDHPEMMARVAEALRRSREEQEGDPATRSSSAKSSGTSSARSASGAGSAPRSAPSQGGAPEKKARWADTAGGG
jgi:hypothetical protein